MRTQAVPTAPRAATRRSLKSLSALALAGLLALGSAPALATPVLPAGTQIAATLNGQTQTLLGLDQGFAEAPDSHITRLSALELEYLSSDLALGIDLDESGALRLYSNREDGSVLLGSYSLVLEFMALPQPLSAFRWESPPLGGMVSASLEEGRRLKLEFTDLDVGRLFGSFGGQLSVNAVPEPGSAALAALGLLLLAGRRRAPATAGPGASA